MKKKVLREMITKSMLYSTKNTVELLKVLIIKPSIRFKGAVEVGYINVKNYGRLENCCIPQILVCAS